MSIGCYGYWIMELGPDEVRSLWDWPFADTESGPAEALAWLDPGGSAPLTQTGKMFARTSPIAAAGGAHKQRLAP